MRFHEPLLLPFASVAVPESMAVCDCTIIGDIKPNTNTMNACTIPGALSLMGDSSSTFSASVLSVC